MSDVSALNEPTTELRPVTPAPPEPLPWTKGIGPRYIALFLVIVYYDQLAPRTLAVGGLGPAVMGATVGGR